MVVHAMRQKQPQSHNFILTGYPAFESALQAIRSQVDDYLVKPTDPALLVENIEKRLRDGPQAIPSLPNRRLALLVREHMAGIADAVLNRMKTEPQLEALSRDKAVRVHPVLSVLEELADMGCAEGLMYTVKQSGKNSFAQQVIEQPEAFQMRYLRAAPTQVPRCLVITTAVRSPDAARGTCCRPRTTPAPARPALWARSTAPAARRWPIACSCDLLAG